MTDLRGPLIHALDGLTEDVAAGRYGDPHVGFAVFVSPDGPPTVAVLSDVGATPFDRVRMKTADSETATPSTLRFFTMADLKDAVNALQDSQFGWLGGAWKQEPGRTLGDNVVEGWDKRRQIEMHRQVEETERAADRLRSSVREGRTVRGADEGKRADA